MPIRKNKVSETPAEPAAPAFPPVLTASFDLSTPGGLIAEVELQADRLATLHEWCSVRAVYDYTGDHGSETRVPRRLTDLGDITEILAGLPDGFPALAIMTAKMPGWLRGIAKAVKDAASPGRSYISVDEANTILALFGLPLLEQQVAWRRSGSLEVNPVSPERFTPENTAALMNSIRAAVSAALAEAGMSGGVGSVHFYTDQRQVTTLSEVQPAAAIEASAPAAE